MGKITKKSLSAFLAAVMAAGTLAGCGSSNGTSSSASSSNNSETTAAEGTSKVDTSEHVDLTMYLIGERTPDFDEVYGKINEILEKKLNCSLSVEFLSWGEHDAKYSLCFLHRQILI